MRGTRIYDLLCILGYAHVMQPALDYEGRAITQPEVLLATLAIVRPAVGEFWTMRYADDYGDFTCTLACN